MYKYLLTYEALLPSVLVDFTFVLTIGSKVMVAER